MKRDRGDGGIDARGKDRHRLRWRVNGRRYSKTFKGSIAEARRELRRLLKSADDGRHVAPDRLTVAAWIESWLALKKRTINTRTHERYAELLRLHVIPTLGSRSLQQIAASEIDDLYLKLDQQLSARTVHHVHTVLNSSFNTAVRKGLLSNNPVSLAEAPVVGKSEIRRALESGQLAALVYGFRDMAIYGIVATAALTGARRNEILALRLTDLGDNTVTIARALEETQDGRGFKQPKTPRGTRTIAIDNNLAAILAAERRNCLLLAAGITENSDVVDISLIKVPEDALLFPAPPAKGEGFDPAKPRDARNISKVFARRAKALGFPGFRFHDLRATHETLLLDAGVPVHVVAARCGHDPAILLRVYARRTKKADTTAVAIIGAMSEGMRG